MTTAPRETLRDMHISHCGFSTRRRGLFTLDSRNGSSTEIARVADFSTGALFAFIRSTTPSEFGAKARARHETALKSHFARLGPDEALIRC
jgi:hypothetical protein